YGSLENIYKNLDKIEKKGLLQKLKECEENAFLSKELATIITDVPIDIDLEDAKFSTPDIDELLRIFNELEFKAFGNKLKKIYSEERLSDDSKIEVSEILEAEGLDKSRVNYNLIKNLDDANKLADKLSKSKLFVFDTETDSLNTFEVNLAGVAFCIKPGEAYFVATNPYVESKELFSSELSDRISITDFIKLFKPLFENNKIKKICQNGKYDIAVLKHYDIKLEYFFFDTMLASYVLDPDQKHNMDDLSEKYLNYKPISLSDLLGSKKNADKIFETDLNRLSDYSCEDADITFQLYEKLQQELVKEGVEKLAYEIEFPLVPVLEDIEYIGIKIDIDSLNNFSKDLQVLLDNYTDKIYRLADEQFNINSTQQLQKILYDKLKLEPIKKTKTGYSTDARSLEALKGQHEIIDILLDYRQVNKLKSTYADALPNLINKQTGRIHTTLNQTVASTGRLSSLDPNLQNIPIRTDRGKEIRKAFVPRDKNHVILSADYSQIELRIMASICGDKGLTQAFINGEDIHRSTAALVFKVEPDDVTADMRRKAKEVNFGILYGIGPFGLKNRLGITQNHAKEIIDTYFKTFKNVKDYMENSVESAREKGYAETLMGRRRYLKNINSNNRVVRQFEERVAINMPIQGTAADMIKIAMIKVFAELEKRNTKTKMVLQVHDELLFDAHKDEVKELRPIIKKIMEDALPLNVPVIVDTGVGDNWLDAH
ncbi:DNA polymerase I, partial [Bacteroidota bacterium]